MVSLSDFDTGYKEARARLVRGMERNLSENDPLAGLTEGLLAVTDVLPLIVAKASEPLNEEQRAELGRAAATGAASGTRKEAARLATALNRRTALAVGLVVALTGLGGAGGGYVAGRSSVQAEVIDARDGLVLDLRGARAWIDLIRANPDLPGAISAARTWTDPPTGRKAGAIPLYLEPAKGVAMRQ